MVLVDREVYNVLTFKPLFLEECTDVGSLNDIPKRLGFCLQIATLQTEDAIRQGISHSVGFGAAVLANDVFTYNLHEIGKGHDGATDDEVVQSLFVFASQVLGGAVGQSYGLAHLLGHVDLLARAVDEFKLAVGEENGQRNAGEAAAGAEIENAGTRAETDGLCDGQ